MSHRNFSYFTGASYIVIFFILFFFFSYNMPVFLLCAEKAEEERGGWVHSTKLLIQSKRTILSMKNIAIQTKKSTQQISAGALLLSPWSCGKPWALVGQTVPCVCPHPLVLGDSEHEEQIGNKKQQQPCRHPSRTEVAYLKIDTQTINVSPTMQHTAATHKQHRCF